MEEIKHDMVTGKLYREHEPQTLLPMTEEELDSITPEEQVVQLKLENRVLRQSQRDLSEIIFKNARQLWSTVRLLKDYITLLESDIKKEKDHDSRLAVYWRSKEG